MALGLFVMRDAWGARVATALLWPLGPMAFLVVVSVMLLVATILWPLVLIPVWMAAGLLVWLLT